MKRMLSTLLVAGIATVALATGAHAASNQNAKIMLHALASTAKNACLRSANAPADPSGFDAGVSGLGLYPTDYYAYVLVVNGSQIDGIAGVQFGISYEGGFDPQGGQMPISVYGWTICATLEFKTPTPVWPNPGGGNLVTWNATGPQCLTPPGSVALGGTAVAGYFWMASYGNAQFRLTPRPVDGLAKVASCGSVEDVVFTDPDDSITHLGAIGFGNAPGINPAGRDLPVAVKGSTWSGVKNLVKS